MIFYKLEGGSKVSIECVKVVTNSKYYSLNKWLNKSIIPKDVGLKYRGKREGLVIFCSVDLINP